MSAPPITVIYTAGMCGEKGFDRFCISGLRKAGLRVLSHHWACHNFPIFNLRDRRQHERAAASLAGMVREVRRESAVEHVVLIGHSTGAVVVLDALQHVKEPVGQAVLLAAAVSPHYDLRRSLEPVSRLLNLYSPLDLFMLLAGTSLFGTADGRHRPAAGCVGFHGTGADDPRLVQRRYSPRWARCGNFGGHIGCLHGQFAQRVLAPIITEHPHRPRRSREA